MDVESMIVLLGLYALAAAMTRTFVVNRRLTNTARIKAELQTRLLEKFGTSQELLTYLESPAGQRFVQSATLEKGNPQGRILGSVQSGIILTLAGAAVLALRSELSTEGIHGLTLMAGVGMSVGIAFLTSAYVAYRLSKAWGLMGGASEDTTIAPADRG